MESEGAADEAVLNYVNENNYFCVQYANMREIQSEQFMHRVLNLLSFLSVFKKNQSVFLGTVFSEEKNKNCCDILP